MIFSKNPNLKTTHCLSLCTWTLKWEPSGNVYVQQKLMISFSQRVFPRVKNEIRWLGHPEKNSQLAVSSGLKFKQGVLLWGGWWWRYPLPFSSTNISVNLEWRVWFAYSFVTTILCSLSKRGHIWFMYASNLSFVRWTILMTVLWWSRCHHQDISWPWVLYPWLVMHSFFHVLFPN